MTEKNEELEIKADTVSDGFDVDPATLLTLDDLAEYARYDSMLDLSEPYAEPDEAPVAKLESTLEEDGEHDEDEDGSIRFEVLDWVQSVVSIVIVLTLLFVFVGRHISVDGSSMTNTLQHKDSVFITKMFYKPEFGDIIILHADAYEEIPLVKRVIATEGQTVDIDFEAHTVTVDGVVLDEPYIREQTRVREDFTGPVTVPKGCVFVMGDNRNGSQDSRSDRVGFVDTRNILGKVHFIIMPGKNEFGIRDWGRLGSVYKTTP